MYLIVFDDDSRIANFLALIARERGWTVTSTVAELEFQALCKGENMPDAVMLDLALGRSDGIEQLRFLHAIGYRGVITLMSGFDERVLASAEQVGRSLGLSLLSPLQKPMRAADVRTALDAIEARIKHRFPPVEAVAGTPAQSTVGAKVLPADVAAAIDRGEMELHLQPIIASAEQSVVQLEALIRWRHPNGEVWTPDKFLPAAEREPAVIDRLSMWVVDAALAHYRNLATSGLPIPIAVNISGVNLRSLDFPDHMAERVLRAGVPSSALAFEVTESVAVDDGSVTMDVLTRLRLKGFELAIDDLGMGHSSLNTLRQMPFTQIKIDKTFVAGILDSHDSHMIVSSVISLARGMRMVSVAEGVESTDVARELAKLGIDRLQGYLYSRPLPFDNLVQWLKLWDPRTRHGEFGVGGNGPR
jgi:EAL domain-containing protein (putative c-di-GMP-specific phosphodiesterase class I)/ActR/RegA family two-component response regulator